MVSMTLAKRLRPKTYSIALYLVGFVLLAQLVALISVFYFRRVVNIDLSAPPLQPINPPVVAVTDTPSQPVAPAPIQPVTPPDRITPVVPNPGRLAVNSVQDVAQRVKALNEESARFQLQGDMRLAALALFKAESLDPKDTVTLVNLARLSALEKDNEKARVYWQRVVDLGPGIGEAYTQAREQLEVIDARNPRPADNTAVTTFSSSAAPIPAMTFPTVSRPAANTVQRALYVDRIEKNVATPTASGWGNDVTLRVVIGSGTVPGGGNIQPGKVDIKLYFYDQQTGGAIVPSKATLRVNFLGTRQTWANGQQETLLANYQLSPEQARLYNQKYYGYMLRIYYDGKLQDEKAEPENLLKFFPAAK